MDNYEEFLNPEWDESCYVIVSNPEPIAHNAENVIKVFDDEREANKERRKLKERHDYENLAVATVEHVTSSEDSSTSTSNKNVDDIWKQQGKMLLDSEWLIGQSVELIKQIMSNLIVLRCEFLAYNECFQIHAVSEEFDKIERIVEPPGYDIVITDLENGEHELEFEKMEEGRLW